MPHEIKSEDSSSSSEMSLEEDEDYSLEWMEPEQTNFLWVVKNLASLTNSGIEVLAKANIQTTSQTRWLMQLKKIESSVDFVLSPDDDSMDVHVSVAVFTLTPDSRTSEKRCSCYASTNKALHVSLIEISDKMLTHLVDSSDLIVSGKIITATRVEPDEQVVLHNLVAQSLSLELEELLKTGKNHDITIEVKGRKFGCHKAILASRSKQFRWMLGTAGSTLTLPVIEPEVFERVLRFVYTGELHVEKTDKLELQRKLLNAAEQLQMESLKAACEEVLLSSFSTQNVLDIHSLSLQYHLPSLKKRACCAFSAFAKRSSTAERTKEEERKLPVAQVWCVTDNVFLKGSEQFRDLNGVNCQSVHITDHAQKIRCLLTIHYQTNSGADEVCESGSHSGSGTTEHGRGIFTVTLTLLSSAAPALMDYRISLPVTEEAVHTATDSRRFEVEESWDVARIEDLPTDFYPLSQDFRVNYECMVHKSHLHELKEPADQVERLAKDISSLVRDSPEDSRFESSYIANILQFVSLAYGKTSGSLDAKDLLLAGNQMDSLQQYQLKAKLYLDNALKLYEISKKCKMECFKIRCTKYIAQNFIEVLDQENSTELFQDFELVKTIIEKYPGPFSLFF